MPMELLQNQVQRLNQQQLQSVELLQMSALELEGYLRELAQENPVIELEDSRPEPERPQDEELLRRLRWLEDNDQQNRYLQHVDAEELDPLARVGTEGGLEESLFRFLSRQLYQLELDEDTAQTVRYLAACLDEDGYLRAPLEELAQDLSLPLARLEECAGILRSLEPAGVGAADLSQCLALQLRRIHEEGPALEIALHHLEALARRHYRAISAQLSIPLEEVYRAEQLIRELEPRPGALFEQPAQVQYILPDVLIEEQDGQLTARLRGGERAPFQISGYYRTLLRQSDDREVKDYLTGKLRQAEGVLHALGQRDSTLLRCAQVIARRQAAFFREGPQALVPMRLADVAQELELHESTVSRAVREKYLQCSRGGYPLSYFFSRSATAQNPDSKVGGTAARALLRRLIDQEDKSRPLSDQRLGEAMAQLACPISRRTVAKYREELGIPSASGRRARGG